MAMESDFNQRYNRSVMWIVIDGLSHKLARRCIETGIFPSLAKIAREGYVGALDPPKPNCQTPPALLSLFSGTDSTEHGVWGFKMPDYGSDVTKSTSGFERPIHVSSLWQELETRGYGYTLINAAFRQDPAWSISSKGADLLFDGYRYQKKSWEFLPVSRKEKKHCLHGIEVKVIKEGEHLIVKKTGRLLARIELGQVASIQLSKSLSGAFFYLEKDHFMFFPYHPPRIRLTDAFPRDKIRVPGNLFDGNIFRFLRRFNVKNERCRISIESQMKMAQLLMHQIGDLAVSAYATLPSRLFIVYFSPLDDICHAYMDLIEDDWPTGPAHALIKHCVSTIDTYLDKLLKSVSDDTLVVVTSDHGHMPHRRKLFINELLSARGLIRQKKGKLDFSKACLYYHPADCGQVIFNPSVRQKTKRDFARSTLERIVDEANKTYGAQLDYQFADEGLPFFAFLYPRGDTHLDGDMDKGPSDEGPPEEDTLDKGVRSQHGRIITADRPGGQHLSPLSGSIWMKAFLGLWQPQGRISSQIPLKSTQMKSYLLQYYGFD